VNKPRDMLEFFRRAAPADADAPPPPPALEPTTRMLVLRRSQAVVAMVAAAAALLLAFLLGHAVGASGGGEAPLPEMFVIRAATYKGELGKGHAQSMKQQLEKMDLGDEVQVLEVPSESSTVVTVGSWFTNPEERKEARALLGKLRGLRDSEQATPFSDAEFWRMKR